MSDHRLIPARPDLAASRLAGKVEAARFADGEMMQLVVDRSGLREAPSPDARLVSEVLFGELFEVFEIREGWAWGQAPRDQYVGYVAAVALAQPGPAPNHKIISPRSFLFPGPDLKLPIEAALPYGALVQITDRRDGYGFVPYLGWISEHNLGPLNAQLSDPVALALRFVETPYLWGGRTAFGCDCSGLVQTVLEAAGMQCPRDADQQQARFAEATGPRQRGDLVFWQGHVGMMVDGVQLVHANAYHMAVQVEPLADTIARYEAKGLAVLATCRP